MAVKTITITVEAHRKLLQHKREGESFTDVINRVMGGTPTLELAGVLSPAEGEAIAQEVRRNRMDLDKRTRRRLRTMHR